MLKKLDVHFERDLINLIKEDEVNNLQFYEYLPYLSNQDERFGFYGYFNEGALIGALYYSPFNTGFAVKDPLYIYEFFREVLSTTESMYIFGRHDYIQRLGELPNREIHVFRYGSLPIQNHYPKETPKEVKQATKADIPALIAFYKNKDIMIEIPERIESIIEKGSVFIVKQDEEVISAALAHSETEKYALIGAVYTAPEHTGKGYGVKTLRALVQHLHQHRITPYLFYEKELVHLEKIYKTFSFQHHNDIWMLY